MRAALLLALAACGSKSPTPATATTTTTITTTTGPTDYPPANLKPPTSGLAVGIAAHVAIDDTGKRVFARQGTGIDILALDSGKKTGRIDLSWDGELWPAAKNLLALRANGFSIDVALVDPAAARMIASCSVTVKAPANAAILRVDEFTTHAGTTYLKWETSPQARQMGGAAVSDEQMAEMNRDFQDAYACGLYAIHVTGSRCTLDIASYQDAGLDACGTRSMPWNRYLPTPIGDLALSVERSSAHRTGLYVDTETLIVKDAGGGERWRLPIETRATPPPPP